MDRDISALVHAHAGFSACDHPQTVEWEDQRLPIRRIIKEWREPGSKHYLVETAGEQYFSLVYLEDNAKWLVTRTSIKFRN